MASLLIPDIGDRYQDKLHMGSGSTGTILGGGGDPNWGTQRTDKIINIDKLMKRSMYLWGGLHSESQMKSNFGNDWTKRCPKKLIVDNYNNRDALLMNSPSSNYTSNRCVCQDDIATTTSLIPLKIYMYADSSLTLNVSAFNIDIFLSNSSSSTTSIYPIVTGKNISKIQEGTTVEYTINLELSDMSTWSSSQIFGRNSYICGTINADWDWERKLDLIVLDGSNNESKVTNINNLKSGSSTGNFGITWREFMSHNDYKLGFRVSNKNA